VGQSDDSVLKARALLGPSKIIGLTVDTLEQLHIANTLPINYVGIGAVFSTPNKPNVQTLWCLDGLQKAATLSKHPIVAIGDIHGENVRSVMQAGAYGIAAIGAFHDAPDPKAATRHLCHIIEEPQHD
jgi:thiamine-phosphate pyrophosphorylase